MRLSISQIVAVWIVTLNSVGINLIVLLKDLYGNLFSNNNIEEEVIESQMVKALKKSIIKVAIYRNKAYWVLNNVIYTAEIDEDGNILNDNAEVVDVFKLSEKEVENLLTILDSINN